MKFPIVFLRWYNEKLSCTKVTDEILSLAFHVYISLFKIATSVENHSHICHKILLFPGFHSASIHALLVLKHIKKSNRCLFFSNTDDSYGLTYINRLKKNTTTQFVLFIHPFIYLFEKAGAESVSVETVWRQLVSTFISIKNNNLHWICIAQIFKFCLQLIIWMLITLSFAFYSNTLLLHSFSFQTVSVVFSIEYLFLSQM